jgi:hypothetical protein
LQAVTAMMKTVFEFCVHLHAVSLQKEKNVRIPYDCSQEYVWGMTGIVHHAVLFEVTVKNFWTQIYMGFLDCAQ